MVASEEEKRRKEEEGKEEKKMKKGRRKGRRDGISASQLNVTSGGRKRLARYAGINHGMAVCSA